MLAMIAMGGFFGATLDTYNRFLKRSMRKRWIVFIHDLLFWILQGLIIFYVLFHVNYGEVRLYIFLALLCGFAAYQALVKGVYLKLLERIIWLTISFYKMLVGIFIMLIYNPIRGTIRMLIRLIIAVGKGMLSLAKTILNVLLSCIKLLMKPFLWILRIIYGKMPKRFKITVEKNLAKMAGLFIKMKNLIIKYRNRWKK